MTVKSTLVSVLTRWPPLFRICSRTAHRLNRRFRTLSVGTPEAIGRAFETARRESGPDIGDYYEFGLYRGYTFLAAYEASKRSGLAAMRFYGFDSFRGLPELQDEEAGDPRFFQGQFAASREQVRSDLTKRGMDWSRAELIEGYYEDSLTDQLKSALPRKHAGVVLLDCDLYSSTVTALDWLDDLVRPGSILLFDDWESYGDRRDIGQPRAFHEYLAARPHWRAEDFGRFSKHGLGFVLRQA